jgi:radical SAM superfamily enzyme YgiQ (UPF0313 family)
MKIQITNSRQQTKNLDIFPIIDRSLIDYEKYHKFIGHAGVKYSMAIQATRGCPYKCFFCDIHKTSKIHYRRSIKHLFGEVKLLADIGIKRIEFIDDIFNVNKEDFRAFFELVLKQRLDLEFFFPTGLRGDLLNKDMIDLMIEAGTVGINLALEHASVRLQKLMGKNLDVEELHENLQYISEKYPRVILVLNAMHGFPTETEEEALMTLNYIKSIRWIHFPYLHNVIIFPGTELEKLALEAGISRESIEQSQDMSYHQIPSTLPFSREFTRRVRTIFLREYVLNKERLLHILPYQLEQFSEDELNQKYNSYFPTKIKSLDDLLDLVKIDRSELGPKKCFDENQVRISDLKSRIKEKFPPSTKKRKNALRLMLIDLSTYFSNTIDPREYSVLEPPMGLMALLTYINQEFRDRVEGRIYKSRIDFESYQELYNLINAFSPDIIGIRAMTFYKVFFHEAIAYIRKRGITLPIIAGGPYPTASYNSLLQDKNINLVVIGEGEITLAEIIEQSLANNNRLPDVEVLKKIPGIAFFKDHEPI